MEDSDKNAERTLTKEVPWVFVSTLIAFSDLTTIMIALNEWCDEEGKDKIAAAPELRRFLVELVDDRIADSNEPEPPEWKAMRRCLVD